MPSEITSAEYRALAELRYLIRKFVGEGDAAARAAGLEPQQYLLLLALRGLPEGQEATIRTLADRLALKHHSAVELIDRLEVHGYVRRSRNRDDRRRVLVTLLPRGEKLLEQVARDRIGELRASGAALVSAISALLEDGSPSRSTNKTTSSAKRGSGKKRFYCQQASATEQQQDRPEQYSSRRVGRLLDNSADSGDFRAGDGNRRALRVRGPCTLALDRVVHESVLLRQMEHDDGLAGGQPSGCLQRARSRRRRSDHRRYGPIRVGTNSRPRNTGGHRGDPDQWQPRGAKGCATQTDFFGDLHRFGRSVRRGGSHHHDGW